MKPYLSILIFIFLLIITACKSEDTWPVEVQKINVREGWGSFSTYLEISEDIEILFADHLNKIDAIRDIDDSTMYYPKQGICPLNRIDFYKGYQIKANEEFTVEIRGTLCRPENITFVIEKPIEGIPSSGWKWIPYIRNTVMTPWELHQIIGDNLEFIKNDNGFVYWVQFDVDQIGSLYSGKAYHIKCSDETRFSFPPNTKIDY